MPSGDEGDWPFRTQIEALQRQSLGEEEIVVAVLDGPVDLSHSCFENANLRSLDSVLPQSSAAGLMAAHGTHVASIIFGQPGGPIRGIAPRCRGLLIPIFSDEQPARLSQLDLARAIERAMAEGAHLINISGGERIAPGASDPLLVRVVEQCGKNGTLIVAAAGNDGCACAQTPAALQSVLTVGACDADGVPLPSSNWGDDYAAHGILAPGKSILGAVPGGTQAFSGTSFATPIVTGVAALLLSLQLRRGQRPSPLAVRRAILGSAIPCNSRVSANCQRFLGGRLNISGAQALIQGGTIMSEIIAEGVMAPAIEAPSLVSGVEPSSLRAEEAQPGVQPSAGAPADSESASTAPRPESQSASSGSAPRVQASSISPSCGCAPKVSLPLIYAIGQLNYDFGTEARRDTFKQSMPAVSGSNNQQLPPNPYDQKQMVDYLKNEHSDETTALIWTLNLELTPIYALEPVYPYAPKVYEFFRSALEGQIATKDSEKYVSRVSIPGVITNRKVRLFSGQVVPVVEPQYRGMYSWNVNQLISLSVKTTAITKDAADKISSPLQDFLNRIYYDLRNLGSAPQDRALNYSATNAFQLVSVWNDVVTSGRQLAGFEVIKSPFCRMDSDCWDVKISFFDPENDQRARKVYRFTIDVSDMMPVTVGEVRTWAEPA
jgi:cyanobactin maturation PatA/PatG family protease